MSVTVSGLSGLRKACRSVLSATGRSAMSGAARCGVLTYLTGAQGQPASGGSRVGVPLRILTGHDDPFGGWMARVTKDAGHAGQRLLNVIKGIRKLLSVSRAAARPSLRGSVSGDPGSRVNRHG